MNKAFPIQDSCSVAKVSQVICKSEQSSKLKKMSGRKFATSYENLVATLKMLVAKLIEAINFNQEISRLLND